MSVPISQGRPWCQQAVKTTRLMRFEGKTAIVTGGSRGIGRACVAQLAAEGATVAPSIIRNQDAADSLVAELPAGGRAGPRLPGRRPRPARAHQIVDQLLDQWQQIDVLVNSAGIVQDGLLGAMTADQWRNVIDTNLAGTFNYCHAVTQPMMMERSGAS